MKITLFHLLLVATCLSLITNCNKDNTKPNAPAKKDLISKIWKVEQVLVNNKPDLNTDYSTYRYELNSNGNYVFNIPVNPSQGTWELGSNEQKLFFNKNTSSEIIADILLLSETQLHLEFAQTSAKTGTQKVIYQLKL